MPGHEQSQQYLVNSHYKGIIIRASMHSTPTSLTVLDHLQSFTPLLMLFLAPTLSPRLMITFHIFWLVSKHLAALVVCSNMLYLRITNCSITDCLMVLLLIICVNAVPLTCSSCCSWKGDCFFVSADLRERLFLNELPIFPNEQESQLACISQREDVPFT